MWKRWVTDTHCVTIRFRNNKTKSKCGRFRAIKMTHFLCCSMIRLKYCHQLEFFYFSYTVGDIYGQCFSKNTPAFFFVSRILLDLFLFYRFTHLLLSQGTLYFLIFLWWPNANTDSLKHRKIYNNHISNGK